MRWPDSGIAGLASFTFDQPLRKAASVYLAGAARSGTSPTLAVWAMYAESAATSRASTRAFMDFLLDELRRALKMIPGSP
jgi:hypothetical protein